MSLRWSPSTVVFIVIQLSVLTQYMWCSVLTHFINDDCNFVCVELPRTPTEYEDIMDVRVNNGLLYIKNNEEFDFQKILDVVHEWSVTEEHHHPHD